MLKPTILVASLNRDQSKTICDCLKNAGYQVLVTDQGRNALEMVRSSKPDLVLVDWKLPDLSGLAVTRTIRAEEDLSALPIILRSAEMNEVDIEIGLDAGADMCLKEPLHPAEFMARIRAVLRRSNGQKIR